MPWPELRQALTARKADELFRFRETRHAASSSTALIDFSSNDYLGLATHPDVTAGLQQASSQWGVGSTASHLVSGHTEEHQALENELAAFTGRDRALLFSTGYMANLGTISALMSKADGVFQDRLNHASLLDAAQLSGARSQRYLHSDCANLERRLQRSQAKRKLIITDGVFSMDGDIAPLQELAELAESKGAALMVDDAHGFGTLGASGGGCSELLALEQKQLPILIGTLGKSFGTFGAFVAGSDELIETLIQFARSYIYTTALPPAIAAATRVALELVKTEHWRRATLTQHIALFKAECLAAGIEPMPSPSPIQPVVIGSSAATNRISERLAEQGFRVKGIRPPTVAEGTARLRIALSASHSSDDVKNLVRALKDALTQIDRSDITQCR